MEGSILLYGANRFSRQQKALGYANALLKTKIPNLKPLNPDVMIIEKENAGRVSPPRENGPILKSITGLACELEELQCLISSYLSITSPVLGPENSLPEEVGYKHSGDNSRLEEMISDAVHKVVAMKRMIESGINRARL